MNLPEPQRLGVSRDWAAFYVYVISHRLCYRSLKMRGGSVWERQDMLSSFWRLLGAA